MTEMKDLKPAVIWRNFHALTQVPRPSGHLDKVRRFLLDFAQEKGVEAFEDEAGNIVMRKPATPGMENRKTVILQAHMDMVPQKEKGSDHNFETDPIETYVDGEWVKAKGTTLGADDGLGVAAIMAVMEATDLKHGPVEALITADEETGMYGANGLPAGELEGEILLNLDTEQEGELIIGSAGGVDITASLEYKEAETDPEDIAVRITLKGLKGGHSGLEIGAGRGNANKMLVRLVREAIAEDDAQLANWHGGNMRNAIPREAEAVLTLPRENKEDLMELVADYQETFNDEYKGIENGIELTIEEVALPKSAVPQEIQDNLVDAIYAAHDGVWRYIPSIPGIVETSSNLASIKFIPDRRIVVTSSQRSSVESAKTDAAATISATFRLAGAQVEHSEGYPGWAPDPSSHILKVAEEAYERLFGVQPKVRAIHAGLECGLFLKKYPDLQMVSVGPTLRGVHSPDERLEIETVTKFWAFIKEILKTL